MDKGRVDSSKAARRVAVGASVLAVVLPLSACGGHSSADQRPSVSEITDSLTSGPLAEQFGFDATGAPKSMFTCIAQKLEGSDLSDGALRALIDAKDSFEPSDADQKALTDLPSQLVTCASP